jgi:hypothetical protein
MVPVSYNSICRQQDSRRGFVGVAEDGPPPYGKRICQTEEDDDEGLYGTEEELYEGILSLLSDEYLEERYSLCLEIRDGDRVVHSFSKVACPELILKQLQLKGH